MIKYWNFDIVFQEIPDEVSLAVNLTMCKQHCEGCHSKHLWNDVGQELTLKRSFDIIEKYKGEITCFALFGGDNDPSMVYTILNGIKSRYNGKIKTAWYSGRNELPEEKYLNAYDYIKIGSYKKELGGLASKTTNQRMYNIDHKTNTLKDITYRFQKNAGI